MLPMMCIQLACMNMEVRSVMSVMAVHDANGDRRTMRATKRSPYGQFLKEDADVDDDDEKRNDGESARAARCVTERNEAAHYMPPLPSRMPMP